MFTKKQTTFNAPLFLETHILAVGSQWEAEGKWIQYEDKRRPGLQQRGRLFIDWVCLQIYSADTRHPFSSKDQI